MQLILALVYIVLTVVLAALTVRIVLDVTQSFARHWRPTGAALVAASAVYAVTDPLMRPVRRAVPPSTSAGSASTWPSSWSSSAWCCCAYSSWCSPETSEPPRRPPRPRAR